MTRESAKRIRGDWLDDYERYKDLRDAVKAKSVFKTRQEADEALAKKYGERKDYNKMNEFKNITVYIDGEYYKPCRGELKMNPLESPVYRLDVSMNPNYRIKEAPGKAHLIKDVIFNPPATIVFWLDGSKTVVKTQCGDEFDPEKGLAMAIAKKALGNQGKYFNVIKKHVEDYHAKNFVDDAYDFQPVPFVPSDTIVNALKNFFKHGDDK